VLKVVALGIVNAGKSSLLSALLDRPDAFPSGDVPRVTRSIQVEHAAGLTLVDTPGLDAEEKDVALAFEAASSANQVLWCHSLRMGELRPTELDALRRYRDSSQNRLWRTCFVLTHGDNVASFDVVRTVSRRIAEQLGEIFNMAFIGVGEPVLDARPGQRKPRPFNVVGVRTYWRARAVNGGHNQSLAARSGVPRLRDFLRSLNGNQHRQPT